MTDQQNADRLALIAKIAHKQKVEKATKKFSLYGED